MFKELAPLLRFRSVLFTVTHVEGDNFRVNILPKKKSDSENNALTTPVSVTGTADELDAQLPLTLISFVSSHLGLKNSLDRAKAEMEAATKAAQEEARNKAKNSKKPSSDSKKIESTNESKEQVKKETELPRSASLFDLPTANSHVVSEPQVVPNTPTIETGSPVSEEDEILAEIADGEGAEDEDEAA